MEKNKKNKGEIMLGILQEKSRTKKEWIKKCTDRGMSVKTFYYHFKKFEKLGKIKYNREENEWKFLIPKDLADNNEIRLYIDQIKSNNKDIRKLGADELIKLCQLKVVTHDLFLLMFFETAFKDVRFKDVHVKLLEAFRFILIRNLKEDNFDMIITLLAKNKTAIMDFIKSGSLPLQEGAIYTLRFGQSRDLLELLYEKIEKSEKSEYDYLKDAIRNCLESHFDNYKIEIKRKLFEIATMNRLSVEVNERAVYLLTELSGLGPKFLA